MLICFPHPIMIELCGCHQRKVCLMYYHIIMLCGILLASFSRGRVHGLLKFHEGWCFLC